MIVQELTGECEALFDFEGQEGELSFVAHDLIKTLEVIDDDWMKGRIGTKEGIFPISFVKVISDIPNKTDKSKASSKRLEAPKKTQAKMNPPSGML